MTFRDRRPLDFWAKAIRESGPISSDKTPPETRNFEKTEMTRKRCSFTTSKKQNNQFYLATTFDSCCLSFSPTARNQQWNNLQHFTNFTEESNTTITILANFQEYLSANNQILIKNIMHIFGNTLWHYNKRKFKTKCKTIEKYVHTKAEKPEKQRRAIQVLWRHKMTSGRK